MRGGMRRMAVLENFDPQKFIDNLLRIYCKQQGQELAGWEFVEKDEKEKTKTAEEVEAVK